MTLNELIQAVMLKATGKANIITSTNTKWAKILGIANTYQKTWQHEPGQHWNSLYNRDYQIGTVGARDAYDIDEEVDVLSTSKGDDVYVLTTNNKRIRYELVPYTDLQNHTSGNFCAKIGRQLVFNKVFSTYDVEYGGKIFAPAYLNVSELEDADDEVQVDNPTWLVFMCAAEYIRNDIVKQNQYGNLIAEANNLMKDMIQRNRAGQVRRVRGRWHNSGGAYTDGGYYQ